MRRPLELPRYVRVRQVKESEFRFKLSSIAYPYAPGVAKMISAEQWEVVELTPEIDKELRAEYLEEMPAERYDPPAPATTPPVAAISRTNQQAVDRHERMIGAVKAVITFMDINKVGVGVACRAVAPQLGRKWKSLARQHRDHREEARIDMARAEQMSAAHKESAPESAPRPGNPHLNPHPGQGIRTPAKKSALAGPTAGKPPPRAKKSTPRQSGKP